MRMIINKLPPALAALALLGVLMSAPATARAAGNDIQLSGTLTREDFRSLTRQLGFAASYFPLAPAAPLGILGLDAGVEATAVKIAKDSSFWQRAVGNGNPPSYLAIPRLHVQKGDRKSTRLNSSHLVISYAVFCLKKKKRNILNNAPHIYE